MNQDQIREYCIKPDSTIHEAIRCVDRSGRISIALVVDEDRRLLNTVTDGDVRRGILAGMSFDRPVSDLLAIKARTPYPEPITAMAGTDPATLLAYMQEKRVRQLPLLDEKGRVDDIVLLSDLLNEQLPMQAVIMAGGMGTRLRPLTDNVPKPMLKVKGRPIIEMLVEQLRDAGIRRVNITTHYLPDKIQDHFGDGKAFGVDVNYVQEDMPLGTGGALGLLPSPTEPLLVINGDILTQVNFSAVLSYHQEHNAEMTVGVRQYEIHVPYGVVECDGSRVTELKEKPTLNLFVNAGIYVLEPSVFTAISAGDRFDMTELIDKLLAEGRNVVSFPIREYWLDIGRFENYAQAQEDTKDWKQAEWE